MGGTEKKTIVQTVSDGLKLLDDHVKANSGNSYALLSRDADVLLVTAKAGKPCLGELRPYKSEIVISSDTLYSQSERAKDYHPGDLPHKFPTGEILAVSVHSQGSDKLSAGFKLMFSEDSPWTKCLSGVSMLGEEPYGYLVQDTNIGPSMFISLLMTARYWSSEKTSLFETYQKLHSGNPRIALLASFLSFRNTEGKVYIADQFSYSLKAKGMAVSSFTRQKPFDIDGGSVWRDRAAYNRPWIHDVFGHGFKNKIPFGKIVNHSEIIDILLEEDSLPIPTEMSGEGTNILKSCGDRTNSA